MPAQFSLSKRTYRCLFFDDHFEILSVASPSLASMDENVGPAMPELAAPQGLIGSAHYCQRA